MTASAGPARPDRGAGAGRPGAARAASRLDGLAVGLLDISKARGNVFLDRVAELLQARGVTVRRYRKPTFTRPAPTELAQQIAAECQLVVEGLAD
jgi:16S rRNA G527 N7-methylase RsmG